MRFSLTSIVAALLFILIVLTVSLYVSTFWPWTIDLQRMVVLEGRWEVSAISAFVISCLSPFVVYPLKKWGLLWAGPNERWLLAVWRPIVVVLFPVVVITIFTCGQHDIRIRAGEYQTSQHKRWISVGNDAFEKQIRTNCRHYSAVVLFMELALLGTLVANKKGIIR